VGYSVGEKIICGLISAIFLVAWPSILAAWTNDGDIGARTAVHDALKYYFYMTIGPLIYIIYFSYELTEMISSHEYVEANGIVGIIAFAIWLSGLKKYISRPLEILKKYRLMSYVTMTSAVINILLNIMLIPILGIIGAALATLASSIVSFILFLMITETSMITVPWAQLAISSTLAVLAAIISEITFESFIASSIFYALIYFCGIYFTYNIKHTIIFARS
jgi:O-antigen/teichoic acid export membrane protein